MATKRKAAIKLPPLEEIKLIISAMYLDYNKATAIKGVILVVASREKGRYSKVLRDQFKMEKNC